MLEEINELERRALFALRLTGGDVLDSNGGVVGLQAIIGELQISSDLAHRLMVVAAGKMSLMVNDSGKVILYRDPFELALLQLRKLQLLDDLADV